MRRSTLLLVGTLLVTCLHTSSARSATGPTTPTFVLTWGNNGSAPGQFSGPFGVATDASGYVYVVENTNNRVQKFDDFGNFVVSWGSSGSGNGQFSNPLGIAIDPSG